jgi:excisionase family DNA binding protein
MPNTVSVREAANALGLRIGAIYESLWSGRIAGHLVNGRWRVSKSAVNQRLRERAAKTKGQAITSRLARYGDNLNVKNSLPQS